MLGAGIGFLFPTSSDKSIVAFEKFTNTGVGALMGLGTGLGIILYKDIKIIKMLKNYNKNNKNDKQ